MTLPARVGAWRLLAVLPFLFASLPIAVSATEPSDLAESATVELVPIDVEVLDSGGNVVPGLGPDDFELRIDGVSTPFSLLDVPAGDVRPHAARGVADRTWLVVVVDSYFTQWEYFRRVAPRVADFAEQAAAGGASVMVVRFGRTAEVLRDFTTDPELAGRAIREMAGLLPEGATEPADLAAARARVRYARSEFGGEAGGRQRATQAAQRLRAQGRATSRMVETLLEQLGAVPGRKSILLVSDGPVGGDPLRVVDTRNARTNRVRIFTLEPDLGLTKGLDEAVDVEDEVYRDRSPIDDGVRPSGYLVQVAVDTLGMSSTLSSPGPFLDAVRTRLDGLYTLGIERVPPSEEVTLDVEVRVREPGDLDVRHVRKLNLEPLEARVRRNLEAVLVLGGGDNPRGLEVGFGEPRAADDAGRPRGWPEWNVDVTARIPYDSLPFVPRGGPGAPERADVVLYAQRIDHAGRIRSVERRDLSIEKPAAGAGPTHHEVVLPMRFGKGESVVVVGLRDAGSTELSTVGRFVRLPEGEVRAEREGPVPAARKTR